MMITGNDLSQFAEAKKITVEEYLTLLDLKMKESKRAQKQYEDHG